MRAEALVLALLGTSARGCLRGSVSRGRDLFLRNSVEDERSLREKVMNFSASKEPYFMKSAEFDAPPKESEKFKAIEAYTKRVEGKKALTVACGLEKEFLRCNLRKGFGSALDLPDCLVRKGDAISERCLGGIEKWKSLLAETSKEGARYPLPVLKDMYGPNEMMSLHSIDVLPISKSQTQGVVNHAVTHEQPHERGHHDHGRGPPPHDQNDDQPRGRRPPPHDHGHGHERSPFSGRHHHGPPPPRDDHHGPPRSTFDVLLDWVFEKPEDSSEESPVGSSDYPFVAVSRSGTRSPRSFVRGPPPHASSKHLATVLAEDYEEKGRSRDAHRRPDSALAYGTFVRDPGFKHGDHLRFRNRLPDEFEDSHFGSGDDVAQAVCAVVFVFGVSLLIVLLFFLMSRAIKLMVVSARRANGSRPFGVFASRHQTDAANAAAADGYQALPENSADEGGNSSDDDAIVVTGTPVNPPPSVHA